MGDALDGLVKRLDRISKYHDVACVLMQCTPASQKQTASSTLWALLAHLSERSKLEPLVKAAKGSSLDLKSWPTALEPFIGLQETMIKTMERLPRFEGQALLDSLDMTRLPRPYVNFVRIIKLAKRRYHNFQTHGQFTLAGKELFQPLHEGSRENVKKILSYALGSLDETLLQYDVKVNNLLQAMILNNDFQAHQDKQDINQAILAAEIKQLQKNLGAHLQAYERENDDLDAAVSKAFQNIKDSISAHDLFVNGGGFPSLMLSGEDARFTGQTNIREFAVNKGTQPLALAPGQILQVDVSGQWSPTCALRTISEIKQGESTIPVKAEGALTGPGGFYLSKNSSGYSFKSGSQQESTSALFQAAWRKCSGGPEEETLTVTLNGEKTTYCQNPQKTTTTNTGSSSDSYSAFAYNSGWKMPGTPIPEAPVGSLVLVMMPKGEQDIKKLKSLLIAREPSFSFPIDEPVDLYFVVNDRVESCQKDSTYKLTLSATILSSQKDNARRALSRMSCVLKKVREKRNVLVQQGELLASDKEAIKVDALNKLGYVCNPQSADDQALGQISLSAYHVSLLDAFRAMLEKEILHLERAVTIENLKNALSLKQYEQQVILTEKNNALAKENISAYLMKQNISNIDTDYLYHVTEAVTKVLIFDLFPIIKLWYPEVLAQGGISSKTYELSQLQSLDLNANLKDVAVWMKQIAKVVETDYTLASMKHFNSDIRANHTVILRIPRNTSAANAGIGTLESALAEFLRMDKDSSQLFWQAVEKKQRALLTINPNDMYRSSGTHVLGCFYELPILRSISLILVFDKDMGQLNSLDRWLGGASNMHQRFTTRGGLVNFDLNPDAEWKRFKTPLYYATPSNITGVLNTNKPQDILGLSPFSSLEIKFDELDADLFNTYKITEAKEILVVLDLEGYKTNPTLTWIESCSNAS
jgi:hypothetical protein